LNVSLIQASIQRFADGEVCVEIHESVWGEDIFIIQSTSSPTNDNLMELLVTIDALRQGSTQSITAVIPYYGYGRQDRKTTSCSPISAKLVANLLTVAGANRILSIDWHSPQIQGFFDIPVDHLTLAPLFCRQIQQHYGQEPVVIVSPDTGGVVRARDVAKYLRADMAIIDKHRPRSGESLVMNLIGDVGGRACVLIDDLVDSGRTLCCAVDALVTAGAKSVDAYVTHGVLSGNALKSIQGSSLRRLVISDTIQVPPSLLENEKIKILSVAPLLARAIDCIANNQPLSCLSELILKEEGIRDALPLF
jgi:ribose-phosphate pyrophosphokinase